MCAICTAVVELLVKSNGRLLVQAHEIRVGNLIFLEENFRYLGFKIFESDLRDFGGWLVLWIHITGFASWRRPSVQLRCINSGGAAHLYSSEVDHVTTPSQRQAGSARFTSRLSEPL